jgi:hypothetical protein
MLIAVMMLRDTTREEDKKTGELDIELEPYDPDWDDLGETGG